MAFREYRMPETMVIMVSSGLIDSLRFTTPAIYRMETSFDAGQTLRADRSQISPGITTFEMRR
jgi:hypothetical protein